MLKRTIPLLLVIAIVIAAAPDAQACFRCKFTIDAAYCVAAIWGRTNCVDDEFGHCVLSGGNCSEASPASNALASEFQVVSVERIDDEVPAPNEAVVARLDVPLER
jgi:hypothetical protein